MNQPFTSRVTLYEDTPAVEALPPMHDAVLTITLPDEQRTDTIRSFEQTSLFRYLPAKLKNKAVEVHLEAPDYLPLDTTVLLGETLSLPLRRDPLRLRSGTGTNYKILGKYKKDTEIIVVDKTTSSWYEVTCPDGKHGYMSAEYLTYVRTETQSTQTNVGFRNEVIESRQLRDQPFRIYRVVPELDKVTVYARHVFYDLLDNMIQRIESSASAVGASVAQNISSNCLSAHDFTFYSDLTATAEDVCFENINPVEAMLGEGGMAEKYGAELARDWFDVFLVKRVGHDTDVHIREKKNLTGISYDVDETDVVTRIMPTGEDADGNILYLPELYVDSPNIGNYVHPKWIHLPVLEAKEVAEGENYKSLTECYQEMRSAAQAEYEKGCDLPTVTLKVDFINCADTVEYAQYSAMTNIFLGGRGGVHAHDSIHIRLPDAQVHLCHARHRRGHAGGQHGFRAAAGLRQHHRRETGAELRGHRPAAIRFRGQPADQKCHRPVSPGEQ